MACLAGMEILWKENLKKEHSDTNVTAPTTDTMKAYKKTRVTKNAESRDVEGISLLELPALLKALKSCGRSKDLQKGINIHAILLQQGLLYKDLSINNAIVNMYSKCGALSKAQSVFDQIHGFRDVVSWTSLISGYAQYGNAQESLNCFRRMQEEGLEPDPISFACALKACGTIGTTPNGVEIHAKLIKGDLIRKDIVLGTALVDMYAKCGDLGKAKAMFDELYLIRDVILWNALISGYSQHGLGNEALDLFRQMQEEGLLPDVVTLSCILKACGSVGLGNKGEEIHCAMRKEKPYRRNIVLRTSLVDMYAKCGKLETAREVFDEFPMHDVALWNALISGYAQHGHSDEAMKCFDHMIAEGLSPDVITFACILKACGNMVSEEMGRKVHAEVQKQGLLGKNPVLGTALIDMYAKCGSLEKAREVFNELSVHNVISWNTLISSYAKEGLLEEALSCIRRMRKQGLTPDAISFACIIKSCGSIGSMELGEKLHTQVKQQGLLENNNLMLGTALIDMYAKCGMMRKAKQVFDDLLETDIICWNVLITGYAQRGEVKEVFACFDKMLAAGLIVPNMVTFMILLSACSHAGLVEEGEAYFYTMDRVYTLTPTLEHYGCIVDLFSRAGQFDKAMETIEKVPPSDRLEMLVSFLGACRKWVNVSLGRWAFENAIKLDGRCAGIYVCMSNIYAVVGMREEADKVEALGKQNGASRFTSELEHINQKLL